jgi:hypothetical protein
MTVSGTFYEFIIIEGYSGLSVRAVQTGAHGEADYTGAHRGAQCC